MLGIIVVLYFVDYLHDVVDIPVYHSGIIKAYSYSQAYFVFYDTYEETGMRPIFSAASQVAVI